MSKILKLFAAAGASALMTVGAAQAADFYAGKLLTVICNTGASGSTGLHALQVAENLSRVIPGHPKVVVKNVTGSGGVVGINYMGQKAPNDGLTVAFMTTVAVRNALKPIVDPGLQVDPVKFTYIATTGGTSYAYIRTDVLEGGLKKPEDFMKVKHFVMGGNATTNPVDLRARLVLDMLGVPYDYVTGFNGSGKVRTALIQGEVDYATESAPGFRGRVVPTLLKDGTVIGLYYYALDNGKELLDPPGFSEGLKNMTTFHEFYKKVKGKEPSGILWEAFRQMNRAANTPQRAVFLPQGAPKEAYDALVTAFDRLNNDEQYKADSLKKTGAVSHWETGANAQKVMEISATLSPEVVDFMKGYVAKVMNK